MIRYLDRNDLHVYRTIRSEALRTDPDAFGETLERFEGRSDDELRRWFEAHVASDRRRIVIREVDGVPVAMCGFGVAKAGPTGGTEAGHAEGFVWGLFVSPAVRRQGIGVALLEEARRYLAARGARRIRARVAAPNDGALEFYRAAGFEIGEVEGTLRDGSDVPVHRIEMELEGGGGAKRG